VGNFPTPEFSEGGIIYILCCNCTWPCKKSSLIP